MVLRNCGSHFSDMCGIIVPNFLNQNGTSPSKKGFFIGILVLFVFVTFFFGMATSLLYILMFSFFRLLQLKQLLVNLKIISYTLLPAPRLPWNPYWTRYTTKNQRNTLGMKSKAKKLCYACNQFFNILPKEYRPCLFFFQLSANHGRNLYLYCFQCRETALEPLLIALNKSNEFRPVSLVFNLNPRISDRVPRNLPRWLYLQSFFLFDSA